MKKGVVLEKVTKSYGDTVALKDVSLTVEKGEIFGLLGPNGSGKTTMIKCISQLANIDSGSIYVAGVDVVSEPRLAKTKVGLSEQEPKADRYFTIQTLLEYQAGYYGIPRGEAKERVISLLKEFELFHKKDEKAKVLSGGMMRKLSLLKALIHKPDILILDEPTAALDVEARHELWEHVRKINGEGVTVFLTTHYIEEAEEMCDRICFLKNGEVLRIQGTEDLMLELSQNKIRFMFDTYTDIPEGFPPFEREGNDVVISVKLSDQSEALKQAISVLDDNNISYTNFTVKQDSLENIFRRLVNE